MLAHVAARCSHCERERRHDEQIKRRTAIGNCPLPLSTFRTGRGYGDASQRNAARRNLRKVDTRISHDGATPGARKKVSTMLAASGACTAMDSLTRVDMPSDLNDPSDVAVNIYKPISCTDAAELSRGRFSFRVPDRNKDFERDRGIRFVAPRAGAQPACNRGCTRAPPRRFPPAPFTALAKYR